jgi:hypothetical protein
VPARLRPVAGGLHSGPNLDVGLGPEQPGRVLKWPVAQPYDARPVTVAARCAIAGVPELADFGFVAGGEQDCLR